MILFLSIYAVVMTALAVAGWYCAIEEFRHAHRLGKWAHVAETDEF